MALAGTEDLTDWIDNLRQGIGIPSEQYKAAMLVGDELANGTPGISLGHLIATGHSLGGGLASAASVAGGIRAHTFNAAGLHEDTLDEDRYAGSTARYRNAAGLIKAYYVDWDILSLIQDRSLVILPSALGDRIEMDGPPYDFAMTVNFVLAALGGPLRPILEIGSVYYCVQCHLKPAFLYGLLGSDGVYE